MLPGRGEIVGFAIATSFLFFLAILGDKLLLSLCMAKKFHRRQSVKGAIKNMCCRLGLEDAVYFESDVLDQELVLLALPWGRTYVLFGTQLRASLNPKEQNELLWLGLQQVKSGHIEVMTLVTLLSYPYYSLLLWLDKLHILTSLKIFVGFMLYPYFNARDLLASGLENNEIKKQIDSRSGDKSLLLSVAMKKSTLGGEKGLLKSLLRPNVVESKRFIRDDVRDVLTTVSSVA